jgi:AcrR family transcriptional regulator
MKDPQQPRSEDSANRMIEAALKIAAENGLAAVTVARVAARARTSNGALYHRFGNREGLLAAASDRLLSSIEAELARALADASRIADDLQALRTVIEAHLNVFDQRETLLRAFMIEGRGEAALERRGFAASALVGRTVSRWLIERFRCSPRTADTVYRLLFAFGTARVVLPKEYSLTSYSRSDKEVRKDLLDIILKVMRNTS